MKKYITVLVFFIISGCIREYSTINVAYLENITEHNIKILFYKNGVVLPKDTIVLKPDTKVEFGRNNQRGIENHGGFASSHPSDSCIVFFDEKHSVTHYIKEPADKAKKYYLYKSLRNINNYLSYDYSFEDVSEYSRHTKYTYTFTEEDYNFAVQ